MLGCEEFEEASILVTQILPRLIGKMSPWPTVVERIAGLESRIPTIAVFFGPILRMKLYLAARDALEYFLLIIRSSGVAAIAVAAIFWAARASSTSRW